jgi:hypothetical protein
MAASRRARRQASTPSVCLPWRWSSSLGECLLAMQEARRRGFQSRKLLLTRPLLDRLLGLSCQPSPLLVMAKAAMCFLALCSRKLGDRELHR